MTNIKVWGRRNSVNVQKVMWALGEMNLEFRRYDIGGSFGINDNYLKLISKVPHVLLLCLHKDLVSTCIGIFLAYKS